MSNTAQVNENYIGVYGSYPTDQFNNIYNLIQSVAGSNTSNTLTLEVVSGNPLVDILSSSSVTSVNTSFTDVWDGRFQSVQSIPLGVGGGLSFMCDSNEACIGFSQDPTFSSQDIVGYFDIGLYLADNNVLNSVENNTIAAIGTWAEGDLFLITFNGTSYDCYQNGVAVVTGVAPTITDPIFICGALNTYISNPVVTVSQINFFYSISGGPSFAAVPPSTIGFYYFSPSDIRMSFNGGDIQNWTSTESIMEVFLSSSSNAKYSYTSAATPTVISATEIAVDLSTAVVTVDTQSHFSLNSSLYTYNGSNSTVVMVMYNLSFDTVSVDTTINTYITVNGTTNYAQAVFQNSTGLNCTLTGSGIIPLNSGDSFGIYAAVDIEATVNNTIPSMVSFYEMP